ncbi:hypothetical protein BDF22DRAFT_777624 [Syncephalis plumigaleata]|nr:hypothetical protein BDF22DRAFT_777624 [Syncephalis plumigaleata]
MISNLIDVPIQQDSTEKTTVIPPVAPPSDLQSQAEDLTKYVYVAPGASPDSPRILVTYHLPPEGQQLLEDKVKQHGWSLVQWRKDTIIPRDLLLALFAYKPNGVLCKVDVPIKDDMYRKAGSELKVLSTMSVGHDHIDVTAAKARGIHVGYTPDALTDACADMTIALVLATARRLNEQAIDGVREGRPGTWEQSWILGTHIGGKTVGILGLGRIGLATAKRLRAFNVESDILCICCNLNESTRGIIGYNELCQMKPTSILVNTARGGVINQDGLIKALKEKRISGAGLDVAVPEPLPPNHELLQLSNCIVVPHIASATHETRNAMAITAVENLCAGIIGEPLPYYL